MIKIKQYWNKIPTWLKGGIIGCLTSIIVAILLFNFGWQLYIYIFNDIPFLVLSLFKCYSEDCLAIAILLTTIWIPLIGFIIGIIIGWIVKKYHKN